MRDVEHTRRTLCRICIASPDASWPVYFSRERLRPWPDEISDELQRFGSTAVGELSAKPIIDMMAPVISLDQADALGHNLAAARVSEDRCGFIKRRFFRRKADSEDPAYHLHLVLTSTWPLKNELLLRDWLIRHSEVGRAYEALKIELVAVYGDDMPQYTAGKTSFLRGAGQ